MKKWLLLNQAPEWLLALPESGYGYQLIRGTVWRSRQEIFTGSLVVLNSQLVVPISGRMPKYLTVADFVNRAESSSSRSDAISWDFGFLAEQSGYGSRNVERVEIRVEEETLLPIGQSHLEILALLPVDPSPNPVPPPGTTLTVTRQTSSYEGYIRYNFLPVDHRVAPNGHVRSGTYATPWRDGVAITSGFSAVGRYALPVPLPASYARVLIPSANTVVRIGTAVPLFGQAGGGVEAFFPHSFYHQTQAPVEIAPF